MKHAEKIPRHGNSLITAEEWKELADGHIWELDESDRERWGYKDTKTMRESLAQHMRTDGVTAYTVAQRGDRVFVQVER